MSSLAGPTRIVFLTILIAGCSGISAGQRRSHAADSEFGPVVTAYLGYLSNEQEVVDDRASRREITSMYYRRNSNRIGALRQMTIRLTRQTGIDYVPELEAVTSDEFGTIFENPPRPSALRQHEVIGNKFRFLGVVHGTETFYVFARLDPYEQADLMQRAGEGDANASTGAVSAPANGQKVGQSSTRARRAIPEN